MARIIHDDVQAIRARLEKAQTVAVFAHIRPDGDSVGSALAVGWALRDMGKTVQFVSEDPIPDRFSFLFQFTEEGKNPFRTVPDGADCYILPDISDIGRAGRFFFEHPELKPDLCIDHHVSNIGFASLNWIESESPAACCVLAGLLPQLGAVFTKRISSALLCGIITDTNSFTTSNVTVESLRAAADLVDHGAEIFPISYTAHKEHSISEMELWKIGMNNIHIDGEYIWSVLTKADRDSIGYIGDDDCGFVSYLGDTKGINVAVLFTEVNENETKISWRSLPGFDVSKVAVACGGGGHAAASGATVRGKVADVIPQVLETTKRIISRNRPK